MIIEISDRKTLNDISRQFNDFFPFLSLAFYKNSHHWYEKSKEQNRLSGDTLVEDARNNHFQGDIEFYSHTKTGDIETLFRKKFDLNVQILRWEGDKWQQTSGSDHLTLDEQQKKGYTGTSGQTFVEKSINP